MGKIHLKNKIGIIGAGIAGLTTAIALKNIGIETSIFESAPKIKPLGAGLGLAANAIKAFKVLGIEEKVIKAGKEIDRFEILDEKGKLVTGTDNKALNEKYGLNNFTIHRARLHEVLLSELSKDSIYLNKKASSVEDNNKGISVLFEDGTKEIFDHLIVADGIHSSIRQQLTPQVTPRYAGYTCWRAVIDNPGISLPAATETWGSKGRFGIIPSAENQIYWFACINSKANNQKLKAYRAADLLHQFSGYHSEVIEVLKHTNDELIIWNDIIDLPPAPHYAFGKIVLIGDAAHATTPNMGQGACQAIEDAVILADEIKNNSSIEEAFKKFEKRRIKRTHWITNTSKQLGDIAQLENYILIKLRNAFLRNTPASFKEKNIERLYDVDF
jgi:2-polyprenyl-6-methoxyphenol hydroxylase-like FAD-dependent oxidoreductase